eukprot:11733629-Alexandrium_andersonii.AAC.1
MSASLVGSEMCIRDSFNAPAQFVEEPGARRACGGPTRQRSLKGLGAWEGCLLYTSDAADDM